MHSSSVPWNVLSASVTANVLTEGWNLAEISADTDETRTFTVAVNFATSFLAVPVVQLGLTGFDIDQRDSARLSVKAENISESGFEVVITTWANTRVYAVEFHWFAIGA